MNEFSIEKTKAEGFDSYAGLAVMKLQEKYPNINLIAVIPAKDTTPKYRALNPPISSKVLLKFI